MFGNTAEYRMTKGRSAGLIELLSIKSEGVLNVREIKWEI